MKAHPGESITWVGFFCEKAEQHRVRTGWLCALACQRSHEDDLIRSALDDRGGCSRCQHHTPGRGAFVIDRLEDCLSRPDTWTDSNHVPWFGDHRRQRGALDVVGLDAAGAPGSGSARRPDRTQVDERRRGVPDPSHRWPVLLGLDAGTGGKSACERTCVRSQGRAAGSQDCGPTGGAAHAFQRRPPSRGLANDRS